MNHINLTSYEGIGSLDRFSENEFKLYCDERWMMIHHKMSL